MLSISLIAYPLTFFFFFFLTPLSHLLSYVFNQTSVQEYAFDFLVRTYRKAVSRAEAQRKKTPNNDNNRSVMEVFVSNMNEALPQSFFGLLEQLQVSFNFKHSSLPLLILKVLLVFH